MRFTDYLWENIYAIRWIVSGLGWAWIVLSSVWMAAFFAFSDVGLSAFLLSLIEGAFGFGHLILAKKAKERKNHG